jgi:hypothetical protein
MLRRTGGEEGSGDCMAAVAGFGTGGVVGGRRQIAEGDLEILVGAGAFVYLPFRSGWVLLFLSLVSFLLFIFFKKGPDSTIHFQASCNLH